MCCLVFKPKGKSLPKENIIRSICEANPDGFGFATPTKIFRTLDYNTFIKALKRVSTDEPCIFHARWATHGSVKISNCHPFKKDGVCFAHNGVLNITPVGDKTDSETAFLYRILPMINKYGLNSRETTNAINSIIGSSKFALMQGNNVRLFGNFTQLSDGCFYSNLRFAYKYRVS